MYKLFLVVFVFMIGNAKAQYYFNDIVNSKQARDNFQLLHKNDIKKVHVSSEDPDGTPTQGFSIDQQVEQNKVYTASKATYSNVSILSSFYGKYGYLASTIDSSDASVVVTTFTYNENNLLVHISSATHENGETPILYSEERTFTYNGNTPASMLLIKNKKDSMQVNFIAEEHGWVGEERWYKKGKLTETYYYYYDEKGRITDIARFDRKSQKILPDYTYEYNPQGKVMTMAAIEPGSNYYRRWHYTYDERGLKTSETVYNKYKQLEGKVLYAYK
jgi:hypothetical protein